MTCRKDSTSVDGPRGRKVGKEGQQVIHTMYVVVAGAIVLKAPWDLRAAAVASGLPSGREAGARQSDR